MRPATILVLVLPLVLPFAGQAAGAAPPAAVAAPARADAPAHGSTAAPVPVATANLDLRLVTDEPEAVLALAGRLAAGEEPDAAAWRRLWESEGYRRLVERETAMGRSLTPEDLAAFVRSPELLGRAEALAATLERWRGADLTEAAERALAYLPAGTRLRATVYPSIKPRDNSFVFDLQGDPAIFLHLDPEQSPEGFANTVAHELHHIGLGAACPEPDLPPTMPEGLRRAVRWMGAFGEGVAMLAAAGGPDVHPHAVSPAADRERWDADLARAPHHVEEVAAFLLAVADGRLTDEAAVRARGMKFFGVQGPWYTVGWLMASTVERTFGRARLVDSLCDPRRLLLDYEAARALRRESPRAGGRGGAGTAGEPLAAWPAALIERLRPAQ